MDEFWISLILIYLVVFLPIMFTDTSDEQSVAATPVTVVADAY